MDPMPAGNAKRVLVQRTLPTDPAVRASRSIYLTETADQGVTAGRRMIEVGPRPAPADIASLLGIAAGAAALVRRKLLFAGEIPVRVATSWIPLALAEGTILMGPDFVGAGLQAAFEALGLRFGRAVETLVARMAVPAESRMLQLDASSPVVRILRSSYDDEGGAVHTLESICAASRHLFKIRQLEGDDAF